MRKVISSPDIWFRTETRTYFLYFAFIAVSLLTVFFSEGTLPTVYKAITVTCVSLFLATFGYVFVSHLKHSFLFKLVIPPKYVDPSMKAVFVTGCVSGFGKELV